jgi:hypothetical protein
MDIGVILQAAREMLAREGRHFLPGRKHVNRILRLQIDRNLAGLLDSHRDKASAVHPIA